MTLIISNIYKKKIIIIAFSSVLLLFFYIFYKYENNFENKLFSYFKEACPSQSQCIVDLKRVTNFDWDKAYFFDRDNAANIQKVIGLNYNFETDLGSQIIFVKNNKVVMYGQIIDNEFLHELDMLPSFSDLQYFFFIKKRVNIIFSMDKKENNPQILYYILTPDNAKLKVYNYLLKDKSKQTYVIYPTNYQQVVLLPFKK